MLTVWELPVISYLNCVSEFLLYSTISWHRPEPSDNFFLSFSPQFQVQLPLKGVHLLLKCSYRKKSLDSEYYCVSQPPKRTFMESNWASWGYKPQKKQCIWTRKIGWQMLRFLWVIMMIFKVIIICSVLCHSCFDLWLLSVYKVILLSLFLGRYSQCWNISNANDVRFLEYFPLLVPDESLYYHSVPRTLWWHQS